VNRFIIACVALLAVGVCSCSKKPDRLPVATVKGSVTFDGKPAAGAMLVFHPLSGAAAEAKLRPVAAVQDDGSFEAHTYDHKDGLPAGEYAVTVHWLKPSGKGSEEEGGAVSRIPARYEKPETSGLKVVVGTGPGEPQQLVLTR